MRNKPIPKSSDYHNNCDVENCSKKRVKCPSCNHWGHPDVYKVDNDTAKVVVTHTHFLTNKDVYRSLHCSLFNFVATESLKKHRWTVIRGDDRFKWIPSDINNKLGWNFNE